MLPSAADAQEAREERARRREQLRQQQQAAQEQEEQRPRQDSSSVSQPVPSPALSLGQRCHQDGLHSIFAFLPLKQLLPAISACRYWRDAAYAEKSRGVVVQVSPLLWPQLAASPLRLHAWQVTHPSFKCSLNDVQILQRMPPSLQKIDLWLEGGAMAAAAALIDRLWGGRSAAGAAALSAMLPQSVRTAVLWLDCAPYGVHGLTPGQLLLDVACGLPALRHLDLQLLLGSASESLDCRPLLRLRGQLQSLRLRRASLTDEMIDVLREMRGLAYLRVSEGAWTAGQLARLAAPQHHLVRLAKLKLSRTDVTAACMESLAKLPGLEELQPRSFTLDALSLLSSLPRLRTLHLSLSDVDEATSAALFMPALASCPKLTELQCSGVEFTGSELKTLAASLGQLNTLKLIDAQLPDLKALAQAPCLRSLVLAKCSGLRTLGLLPLGEVASLRRLEADVPESEVAVARGILAPPASKHLPQLTSVIIRALPAPVDDVSDDELEEGIFIFDSEEDEDGMMD